MEKYTKVYNKIKGLQKHLKLKILEINDSICEFTPVSKDTQKS